MDSLLNLLPIIGPEKTLVIDSTNYWLNTYRYLEKNILVYYPQGGIIQADDLIQQEQLQYYLEHEKCRQLIFIGSINRSVIDKILLNDSPESPKAALKFNLSTLLRGQDSAIIPLPLSERLLIELNVVMQCKLLMDYDFIDRRIENRELQLRGIVAERKGEQFKPVFYNGIRYNDLISLN
jgi:hypothetical protein